jgi:hypothetical protein
MPAVGRCRTLDPRPIAAGDVFVACHPLADAPLLATCDVMSSAVINFNGDDAIELTCHGMTIDVIGQIGVDPGVEWVTDLLSTADSTLRRSCAVTKGDGIGTDVFDVAGWVGFATGTIADLGVPSCAP